MFSGLLFSFPSLGFFSYLSSLTACLPLHHLVNKHHSNHQSSPAFWVLLSSNTTRLASAAVTEIYLIALGSSDHNTVHLLPVDKTVLRREKPKSAEQILEALDSGNRNRTQHPTDMNATSSRSHAVFQIYLRQQDKTASLNHNVCVAKMNLIDLAGSETGSATNAKGARLREGANIANMNLLMCLFCCFFSRMALRKLTTNRPETPYFRPPPIHIRVLKFGDQLRVISWDLQDGVVKPLLTKRNKMAAITDGETVMKITLLLI
ncbi:unnamed protein product [Oreochromis niloticus]|nr:unnamed protein product [Mustela putorius furo]